MVLGKPLGPHLFLQARSRLGTSPQLLHAIKHTLASVYPWLRTLDKTIQVCFGDDKGSLLLLQGFPRQFKFVLLILLWVHFAFMVKVVNVNVAPPHALVQPL